MKKVTIKLNQDDARCVYAELAFSLKQNRKTFDIYLRTEGKAPDWLYKDIAELERVLKIIEKAINEK